MKYLTRPICLLIALGLILSGCAQSDDSSEATSSSASPQIALATSATGDTASATSIVFAESNISVEGKGASANGNILTITGGGTYLLTGALTGSVVVNAPSAEVQLILDGVDIAADQNAAIYCPKADSLTITLAEGSRNTIADAPGYTYADAAAEEPNAAIFSKGDLVLQGEGALTVNASFHHGIASKDDLVIQSGTYQVTATGDAIRGRDSVTIAGGSFTLEAGSDGIQSNNPDADKGFITLAGGTYHINAGNDGIQAESVLTILDGEFSLTSGGGVEGSPADASGSYKGLKAGTSLVVEGGTFAVNSNDDSLHSNGDILVSGGVFELSTGDDAIHADLDLTISGGTFTVTSSEEGFEASTMTISGGTVRIVARDDGINIAGGNDTGGAARFGADQFAAGSSDRWLKITGGEIVVDAEGDGLDLNGSGEISGGTVIVHGPVGGGNSALDYDGTLTVSGGVLLAAGSAGMAQSPSQSSSQPSLMVTYSSQQAAGTTVTLTGEDGATLATYTAEKSFQCIVLSAPELSLGKTYNILTNGSQTVSVSLSDVVTSISDTGEAVAGGMGGRQGGQMGGFRPDGQMGGAQPNDQMGGARPGGGTPPQAGEAPPAEPTPA